MKSTLIILIFIACYYSSYAQPNLQWSEYFSSGTGFTPSPSLIIDNSKNIYASGFSYDSSSNYNVNTVKYHPSGAKQWERTYNSSFNADDRPTSMVIDRNNNLYVLLRVSANFNATHTVLLKYDSSGILKWDRTHQSVSNSSLCIDSSGYLYVLGGNGDIPTVIKYDTSGTFQWQQNYNSQNSSVFGRKIVADRFGNVYIIASSLQSGSFTNYDILVFKFSSTGLQHWTSIYNGQYNLSDRANDIALDAEGNVYVTGYLTSVFTGKITKRVGVVIKYNQFGGFIWSQQFYFSSFPLDEGVSFTISPSGYIYIIANIILDNSYKTIAVLKYSLKGGSIWSRFYDSEINSKNDMAAAIALDSSGDVYATGTKIRINPTIIDIVIMKYDSTGILKWSRTFDNASAGSDYAYNIISDEFGTYVLGVSTFGGSNKYVLLKYSQVTSINNLNEIKRIMDYTKTIPIHLIRRQLSDMKYPP